MTKCRLFLHLCTPLLAGLAVSYSAPAWAADEGLAAIGPGYSSVGAPLGDPTELRIDLRGEVTARCQMTSQPALRGQLDFNTAGNVRASFGLDCNTPFLLAVRSHEGGFATSTPREGVASRIPYELSVDVDTDDGLRALGWCQSLDLSDQAKGSCSFGGRGWSSGNASAIERSGSLGIRWSSAADGEVPALGDYRDTITVDVTVRS